MTRHFLILAAILLGIAAFIVLINVLQAIVNVVYFLGEVFSR